MLRERLAERAGAVQDDFRLRGGEISRVEGFSDAVFAFAITLLVVSLEVPQTFDELLGAMRGFIAFAICFALLITVWYEHYTFFRRYALQDHYTTLWLNTGLLFVVLFYVYPLKFLFTLVVGQLFGDGGMVELGAGELVPRIEAAQIPTLFTIYGLGFIAVSLVFVLMYSHAYRKRQELELNDLEVAATVERIQIYLLNIGIGGISILIALLSSQQYYSWAGWIYFLVGFARFIPAMRLGARKRKIKQRQARPHRPAARNGKGSA